MSDRITKKELVQRVARQVGAEADVETVIDATLEEIYQALKKREKVSLYNFGTFYIDKRRSGTVFKFNPGQRLRAAFGWASTYKGDIITIEPEDTP